MKRSAPIIEGSAPFFSRRSMAMAAAGNQLICFGGVGAAGTESILDVTDDCWSFDTVGMQWREVRRTTDRPEARRCCGFVSTADGVWLWGGSGVAPTDSGLRYTFLNDSWQFNASTDAWVRERASDDHRIAPTAEHEASYPSPRYTPVMAPVANGLLLFSGYTEDRLGRRKLNDAWLHRGGRWSKVNEVGAAGYDERAARPGIRYGCGSAAHGGNAYIFGGFSDDGDHNDIWEFNGVSGEWRLLAAQADDSALPAPRYCAAVTSHGGRVLVFGGRSRRNPRANFNDLWSFDLATSRWDCLSPNRGPHRYDAMAEFPGYHAKSAHALVHDYWYLWGGEGLHGHVSDFWRMSLSTAEWELIQAARPDDPHFW
jgi:hypothetical protein